MTQPLNYLFRAFISFDCTISVYTKVWLTCYFVNDFFKMLTQCSYLYYYLFTKCLFFANLLITYEFQSLNLDSPSKQSYVGSYYQPPETLSRPLYMNTVTDPLDRKSSGVQDISPQIYQRVPDAGSRGKLSCCMQIFKSKYTSFQTTFPALEKQ